MKILVISDSHGRSEYILEAIEKEKPDMVVCCGDYSEDAQDMAYGFPETPFQIVRGNCDYYDIDHKDEILLEISSVKFYITHGHLQNAKGTYSKLETAGEKAGAKVVLFGHTHIPYLEKKKKVILFNPGALMNKEYGIINIFKDSVDFIHKKI